MSRRMNTVVIVLWVTTVGRAGGVVGEFTQRCRAAGAPLVEDHDAVMRRIEEAPVIGRGAGTGTAVQDNNRLAVR